MRHADPGRPMPAHAPAHDRPMPTQAAPGRAAATGTTATLRARVRIPYIGKARIRAHNFFRDTSC